MKILFIVTLFLCSFSLYAQDTTVSFAVVENSPVYPGCENEYSNAARKKCMVEKIDSYFKESFDGELGRELGLSGIILIRVEFEIDKSGKPINIFTRAPHPRIAEEAKNILKSLPDMRPATQRGKAVAVKLANQFSVDLSKLKENAKVIKEYYDNGNLKSQGTIDAEGNKTGEWREYYDTGELYRLLNYMPNNQIIAGDYQIYNKDGSLGSSGFLLKD